MTSLFLKNRNGLEIPISKDLLKVGRAADNDIVLNDISVSRYHVAFQNGENFLLIHNTGSDAGFFVNNQWHNDSAEAHPGDIIRIGNEEFCLDRTAPAFESISEGIPETNTSSGSLNVNPNQKIRRILLIAVGVLVMFLALKQNENTGPDSKVDTDKVDSSQKVTEGLPNESYFEDQPEPRGPQELTAEDLFKRGMRELDHENQLRAIQFFQQALIEDPSIKKAQEALSDTENALKEKIEATVLDAEQNYLQNRYSISRNFAIQALNLLSEQIPGFSFQIQQRQRTLASQHKPVTTREQIYLELSCEQTSQEVICKRAVEVLRRSRMKLGEEEVLK